MRTAPDKPAVYVRLDLDLEWCDQCSPEAGSYDEEAAPGIPREVVSWSIQGWGEDPSLGLLSEYHVAVLSCGHEVATLI
jgi:hypothetical protein